MMLYYHSWMFYNHFIVILYHFLLVTYWHSVKCQLLFFIMFFTSQEINTKRSPNAAKFFEDFLGQKISSGPKKHLGVLRGEYNPPVRSWRPRRAQVGCAHLGCPRTASLLYKYPQNPRTLGESTKYSSIHRRVQNHQIQSRHHLGWGSPSPLVPLQWCVSSSL